MNPFIQEANQQFVTYCMSQTGSGSTHSVTTP